MNHRTTARGAAVPSWRGVRAAVVLLAVLLCALPAPCARPADGTSDPAAESGDNDPAVETFILRHRSFDELRPLIEPFLEGDDLLFGAEYIVAVRTDTVRLPVLTALIRALDTPRATFTVDVRRRSTVWPGRVLIGAATDAPPARSIHLHEGAAATVLLGRERRIVPTAGRQRSGAWVRTEPQTQMEVVTIVLESVADEQAELMVTHAITRFEGRDGRRTEQARQQVIIPLERWTVISGLYTGAGEEAGRRVIASTGGPGHPELEIRITPVREDEP